MLALMAPGVHAQYTYVTNADNTLTITGYHGPMFGVVIVPSQINGLPVTSIGDNSFSPFLLNSGPSSITIPDSVIRIGNGVFEEDTALATVTIGVAVTNIGFGVFEDCGSLNSITVAPQNPAFSSVNGILFDKNQTSIIHYPPNKSGAYEIPDTALLLT